MHVQLWPIGGARVHGLAISYLLCGLMGLSWISVPNFITFEPGVLWAAIDSNGRMVIMIGKRTKTIGVSQLRCLTPKYSCKQQCGAHANGAINGIIDTSNGFQDICKSSHRNPRRLSPDSNRRPSGSQAKSLRTELLSGVSWNGDFCIKREQKCNFVNYSAPEAPNDTRFFSCTWERASKHAIKFHFDKSKRFGHKPKWRKIYPDVKWRHRVRWTRLGPRIPMMPCLSKSDEWVKSY